MESQGQRHQGEPGGSPNFFSIAKAKKGKQRKIRRSFKGCHQGQNATVLAILEHLEFKNFTSQPTMVAKNTFQCSMAHPL